MKRGKILAIALSAGTALTSHLALAQNVGTTRLLTVGRTDLWRSESSAWLLAARDIVLDHAVLPDSNLNAFF